MNYKLQKMKLQRILGIFLITIFIFSSCRKYEEGPNVSLVSKKERVSGLWQCQTMYNGDQDVTEQYPDYCSSCQYAFYKDGNGIFYHKGWNTYFTWKFSIDKEQIIINFQDGVSETWKLLRLTNKEMWFYIENYPDLDFSPEFHFMKIED